MPSEHEKRCFVIMPFDEKFDDVFEFAIQPAANAKGYNCVRMDQIAGPLNLIHEMIHNIYTADVVIADLTGKNANVFYELGLAHSVPVPNKTIMITEENEKIPFDIGAFQVLKYNTSVRGINNLKDGIVKHIEFIETNSNLTSNPVHDYLQKVKLRPKPEFIRPKPDSEQETFDQLYLSQIRITLLHFLNGLPEDQSRTSIRNICDSLRIKKRKFAVSVLYQLEAEGLVEKEKRNQNAFWHISNKGQRMLKKMRENIDYLVLK